MSSHKNNNKKSINHLPFEKNPIFAFFHEEVSMTTRCTHTYTYIHTHLHCQTHTRIHMDTNRIDSNRIDSNRIDRELTEWKKKKFIYFFYISLSSSHLSTLFSKTMMWKFLWNFRKRGMRNISQSCVFKARKGNGQKKILETWDWKKLEEIVRNPNWKQTLYQRKIR